MKKLLTLLVLSAMIFTCQAKELSLNLKAGKVYKQVLKNQMDLQLKIEGQQMMIKAKLDIELEYLVKSAEEKAYEMQICFRNLSGNLSSDQFAFSFDTATIQNNPLGAVFSLLIDKPIVYTMTNTGKIIEIEDLSGLKLNLKGDTTISKLIEQSMATNSGGFMQTVYPDKEVSVGDSWTSTSKIPNTDAEMVNTYCWKSNKGGKNTIALITEDFNLDFSVPLKAEEEGSVRIMMTGKSGGEFLLDKKTGWITESDIQFEAECKLVMEPNPQMPSGAEIPISIKVISTLSEVK